jgi:hypothetical protein
MTIVLCLLLTTFICEGSAFNDFCPNKCTVNEQKDDIMIHNSIDNFQSGQPPNREQKTDEKHACPSYCPMRCLLQTFLSIMNE